MPRIPRRFGVPEEYRGPQKEREKQRPDFASVRVSNRTGKKVRLFALSEPESNRSSLFLELTNTNELNFRLS